MRIPASLRGHQGLAGSLFILLLLGLVICASPAGAAPQTVAPPARDTGQALVEFAAGVSRSEAKAVAASHQATLVREIRRGHAGDGAHLYCLASSSQSAQALAASLRAEDAVALASPNYYFQAESTTPNDPLFAGSQWSLANIWAPAAWDLTTGSRSVVVADLDSGADYTHEDLTGNIWTNPGEIAGNGIDDDVNGYVDDVHGIDAVSHDSDPADQSYHGTWVAGIIGAVGDNGVGMTGVAWRVSVMPVVCLSSSLTGTTAGALEAAWYAIRERVDHGVNVVAINTSWGQSNIPYDPLMREAIRAAGEAGIVWTASAGNSTLDADVVQHYPSGYDPLTILSVASSGPTNALSSFSNYGATSVDLAAPGEDVLGPNVADGYGGRSGTSGSAGMVAGAVALCASRYPGETALQRVDRIMSGVVVVPTMVGKTVTGGRLDLYRSLTADLRPTTTIHGVDAAWHDSSVTATFTATDGTGIGVDHTEYSLDGAAYQRGTQVVVSGGGVHTLLYRSVDEAANVEAAQTATVKIRRSVLVVAPHPDDDILYGAGVVATALSQGDNVKVVYMTNGDFYGPAVGLTRQNEGVQGQQIIGAPENDLIFLGYPDGGLPSLLSGYTDPDDMYTTSYGQSTTYGARGLGGADYHYYKFGAHALYNGANVHQDLGSIIATYRPDDVYTVGELDAHGDHEATYQFVRGSLIADMASDATYRPTLHKTVVHWHGDIRWPAAINPTTLVSQSPDPDQPGYLWSAHQSLVVPDSMQSADLETNLKYQALNAHATQGGAAGYRGTFGGEDAYLGDFIHKDEVFWVDPLPVAPPTNHAPTADAGPSRSVTESTLVTLDGSASSDPDGDALTYAWTQTAGPAVTLSDADGRAPHLHRPRRRDRAQLPAGGQRRVARQQPGDVTITVVRGAPTVPPPPTPACRRRWPRAPGDARRLGQLRPRRRCPDLRLDADQRHRR